MVGAERVLGIMDEENSMPNLGTIKKDHIEGKIEFQNVRFSYDEKQEVLKGVDFKVNPGETVAIVGATGAGKSTIIQLITRFYDINSGNILLDDIDIRDYGLYDLRSKVGVVLQDVFLFHGSIYENLTLGDTIPLEKIKKVAQDIEVVSNSAAGDEPLGTLAGRGVTTGRQKGGHIRIKVTEPCYIMCICSITPRYRDWEIPGIHT